MGINIKFNGIHGESQLGYNTKITTSDGIDISRYITNINITINPNEVVTARLDMIVDTLDGLEGLKALADIEVIGEDNGH